MRFLRNEKVNLVGDHICECFSHTFGHQETFNKCFLLFLMNTLTIKLLANNHPTNLLTFNRVEIEETRQREMNMVENGKETKGRCHTAHKFTHSSCYAACNIYIVKGERKTFYPFELP